MSGTKWIIFMTKDDALREESGPNINAQYLTVE
jgi:hypothetical protein